MNGGASASRMLLARERALSGGDDHTENIEVQVVFQHE